MLPICSTKDGEVETGESLRLYDQSVMLWDWLTSPPGLLGEFQARERSCNKGHSRQYLRSNTRA